MAVSPVSQRIPLGTVHDLLANHAYKNRINDSSLFLFHV